MYVRVPAGISYMQVCFVHIVRAHYVAVSCLMSGLCVIQICVDAHGHAHGHV